MRSPSRSEIGTKPFGCITCVRADKTSNNANQSLQSCNLGDLIPHCSADLYVLLNILKDAQTNMKHLWVTPFWHSLKEHLIMHGNE
ncbi:hypothetical protein PKNOH_S110107300 [Plasmodium knowlesi]|uniref:Uncharacterized protein n=1 Tax=Plasmodium knowlesi TaxID=5850 RepID=A0A1Y3DP90_PLAKN|nr:hypothetical protein PKNOH_S110107300 [Plasmodium knowlesi]